MKATLEFNLPEERCEHRIAVTAMDWALAMNELDGQLRDWLKYGHDYSLDEVLEKTRERLHEILDERNLSLGMID